MSVNIKPINEVPVVGAVAEGDKVLVNRSGAAVQIDASKVGGGGSAAGGVVYTDLNSVMGGESEVMLQAFADIEMTTPMDYETGKNILLGAGKLAQDFSAMLPGSVAYLPPSMIVSGDEAKIMQLGILVSADTFVNVVLVFSDSIGL